MPTLQLVKEAIKALKDRQGSSAVAITKWIEKEKKVRSRSGEIAIMYLMRPCGVKLISFLSTCSTGFMSLSKDI